MFIQTPAGRRHDRDPSRPPQSPRQARAWAVRGLGATPGWARLATLGVLALLLGSGAAYAHPHGHGFGGHGHGFGGHGHAFGGHFGRGPGARGEHFGGPHWRAGGAVRAGRWAGRGPRAVGRAGPLGRGDWHAGWRGDHRGGWDGEHWHGGWGGDDWDHRRWRGALWYGGDWDGLYWPPVDYDWSYPWFMATVPFGAMTITFGGVPYYYINRVYYVWSPYYDGYVVTDPPPVASYGPGTAAAAPPPGSAAPGRGVLSLQVTPLKGQSRQQTANDRYACNRWAVGQSGFNPVNGQQDAQASPQMRGDYRRAFKACLQARGYRVH